jgi:plasmid stability protein
LCPQVADRSVAGPASPIWLARSLSHFAFADSNDSIDYMATLTIRQLDEKIKTRLRVRAAHHGRSMEEEAREILRSALTATSPIKGNLAETIHRRFAAFGGLEFESPRRDTMRQAPEFAK